MLELKPCSQLLFIVYFREAIALEKEMESFHKLKENTTKRVISSDEDSDSHTSLLSKLEESKQGVRLLLEMARSRYFCLLMILYYTCPEKSGVLVRWG